MRRGETGGRGWGRTEAHTPETKEEGVVCEERVGEFWFYGLLEDAGEPLFVALRRGFAERV